MVIERTRYFCEICDSIFEEKSKAEECEAQPIIEIPELEGLILGQEDDNGMFFRSYRSTDTIYSNHKRVYQFTNFYMEEGTDKINRLKTRHTDRDAFIEQLKRPDNTYRELSTEEFTKVTRAMKEEFYFTSKKDYEFKRTLKGILV